MADSIFWASATELAERIRSKEISPVEVVQAHLDRIAAVNPAVNAVVAVMEDSLDRARAAEKAVVAGESLGPLHGVPFTIKDCVNTAGIRTSGGSLLFKDNVPTADAIVVERLRGAGGIMIAKTNLPEFALDAETSNRIFGRTVNPWNPDRVPGGSSGGEGAAIAAGMSPLGIGSDVGGSIRIPATFCGVVGLKATHGRIPLTGHWPETLLRYMHVGPMARTVDDIALSLSILAGPDGVDPYAVPVPHPGLVDLDKPLQGVRVGWSQEDGFAPVAKEVQNVVALAANGLAERGLDVEQVSLPWLNKHDYVKQHIAIFTAEVLSHAKPIVSGREADLTPSTEYFLSGGLPSPTIEEYMSAREDMEELMRDTLAFFQDYDVLVGPTSVMLPFEHDQSEHYIDGQKVAKYQVTKNTALWDYTGSPALSVPFGWSSDGLPIGVQVVGRHFDEETVLRVGAALQAAADDSGRRPPL